MSSREVNDPPGCDVVIWAGDTCARLLLVGELDVAGVENLNRVVHLVECAELRLVLDCRQLTFIDAAGVGALLRVVRGGGKVQGVRGQVRRVFALLGLAEQLTARQNCAQPLLAVDITDE